MGCRRPRGWSLGLCPGWKAVGSEEISDGENVPACFPPWQPLAPDLTCFQETSPLSLSLSDLQDEGAASQFPTVVLCKAASITQTKSQDKTIRVGDFDLRRLWM